MRLRSLALAVLIAPCFAKPPPDAAKLAACPPEGDAVQAEARDLNPLKRRMTVPTATDIDPKVTLAALVAPGDDTDRWDTQRAAVIEGYVADVKVGGIESVNCHTRTAPYRDTHIELTLDPMHASDETQHVIIEVTPQWRARIKARGVDWSTPTLRSELLGRWVRVTGWLLFDAEHKPNAKNTATGHAHIWRATVWEVHPITAIEILPGKP